MAKHPRITRILMLELIVATSLAPLTAPVVHASGPGTTETGIDATTGANQLCLAKGSSNGDSDGNDASGKLPANAVKITVDGNPANPAEAAKAVAKAIGEKFNIDPGWVYGQMYAESGPDFNTPAAVKDKNITGIKGTGGTTVGDGAGAGWQSYQHFDTWSDYASEYATILKKFKVDTAKSIEEYAHDLKNGPGGQMYMEADEASYLRLMRTGFNAYYGNSAASGIGDISGDSTNSDDGDGQGGGKFDYIGDDWRGGDKEVSTDNAKNAVAGDNIKTAYDEMIKNGISSVVASAIIGNLMQESGPTLNTNATNPTTGAFGVGQWLGERASGLESYAQSVGKDKSDLATQIDYLLKKDLPSQKSYFGGDSGLNEFLHSTDINSATQKWESSFERSGGSGMSNRLSYARQIYQQYGSENKEADDSKLSSMLGGLISTADSGSDSDASSSNSSSSKCQDSSNKSDSAASGKWGWPFKSIKSKEDVENNSPLPAQHYGHTGYSRGSGDFHDGWDFQSASWGGQDVVAVHDGTVYKVGNEVGWWYVWVKSSDGYNEIYQEGFNSRSDISVSEGDTVKVGDKIGTLTGTHLHLGITNKDIKSSVQSGYSDDGTWLNPLDVISGSANGSSDSDSADN